MKSSIVSGSLRFFVSGIKTTNVTADIVENIP
jgi:hypothetical protein